MSDQASFAIPSEAEQGGETGRFIVTFRDDATKEGLALLRKAAGTTHVASAKDFTESAVDFRKLKKNDNLVLPELGVAVVDISGESASGLAMSVAEDSAILAIEPERLFYALAPDLSQAYLAGYRDAVNHLYDRTLQPSDGPAFGALAEFNDDAESTWGLKATKVINSKYTGRGIRVAVLDTGLDLKHSDFVARAIVSKSFVGTSTVQDGQGHGTHCIGTACGGKDSHGRRYGVASEAAIYVGKVLADSGSGSTSGILAGMEWALVNKCQVISMSLGNTVPTPSPAYEAAGRRALSAGSLIVAAAGNHRPGTVGQPANASTVMAVGAVDRRLALASFSCGSGSATGANVDLAGPGVAIYSSIKLPARYASINGTSMATPHVAGIAALWSEATQATGAMLWQKLTSTAQRLPLPTVDVGTGLVQAP